MGKLAPYSTSFINNNNYFLYCFFFSLSVCFWILDKFTFYLQVLFQVIPSDNKES